MAGRQGSCGGGAEDSGRAVCHAAAWGRPEAYGRGTAFSRAGCSGCGVWVCRGAVAVVGGGCRSGRRMRNRVAPPVGGAAVG